MSHYDDAWEYQHSINRIQQAKTAYECSADALRFLQDNRIVLTMGVPDIVVGATYTTLLRYHKSILHDNAWALNADS